MIVVDNISKKFGDNVALKNVNLTFDKKEIVFLIGHSGSGKSTLIRCINNLEEPDSGCVKINNEALTKSNRTKLCFKIGMVFQHFNLFPHMNVQDNLIYAPCNVLNTDKEEAINKAILLLEQFSIRNKLMSSVASLSGGQKQRIAICRALMMDPEIMLFDEPVSALDPELVKDIIQIMKELKSKMTMIVVTHNMKFVHILADRIIYMHEGQVLVDQVGKEFFENPKSHRARLFLENIRDII